MNSISLLTRINTYLIKNKFCSDCKLKVLVAFKIKLGEAELDTDESTYKASLFDGIEVCSGTNGVHIHIKNDDQFIKNLISKAKSEINEEYVFWLLFLV